MQTFFHCLGNYHFRFKEGCHPVYYYSLNVMLGGGYEEVTAVLADAGTEISSAPTIQRVLDEEEAGDRKAENEFLKKKLAGLEISDEEIMDCLIKFKNECWSGGEDGFSEHEYECIAAMLFGLGKWAGRKVPSFDEVSRHEIDNILKT